MTGEQPTATVLANESDPSDSIAIVVLTHNRVHLLRQCVANVLARTSPHAREIVIWDNGSTDGTAEYLNSLDDSRLTIVHHPTNIGQNAYAEAFARTTSDYFVKLDDDVIDAPPDWDRRLLEAIKCLPEFGLLAASLVDDPNDQSAYVMYHVRWHEYTQTEINGLQLLLGPTGGGATITPRSVNERVGGYRQKRRPFWLEAAEYIGRLKDHGYEVGTIADLQVHHAGGSYYSEQPAAKQQYWRRYLLKVRAKNAVKSILLTIPFLAGLNARHGWFRPPNDVDSRVGEPSRSGGRESGSEVNG